MRKEIHIEEMMRILTRYKESEITCKRIARQGKEQKVMDKYYLEHLNRKARIYDGEKSFVFSLDGINQVCFDIGKSRSTNEKYLLFTITYEMFHYVSLNIVC